MNNYTDTLRHRPKTMPERMRKEGERVGVERERERERTGTRSIVV